jgi:hypothetical protein
MIHGSEKFRAPSPLFIRGLTLIVIGLALELAIPIGLAIYPGESSSSGNSTALGNVTSSPACQAGTPAPDNPLCGVELGVVVIWNAVGIGLLVLGTSWLLEWRRSRRGSEPKKEAVPKSTGPVAGGYSAAVWVRCPQCGKPVDWPSEQCPRCSYEVRRAYR